MKSLLLDNNSWDFVLDSNRSLAVCSAPYAVLQDVATAIRIWLGEVHYDSRLGVGYDMSLMANASGAISIAREIERVANRTRGVTSAQCHLSRPGPDRSLSGFVRVHLTDGTKSDVHF